jgi:hypothetical protein
MDLQNDPPPNLVDTNPTIPAPAAAMEEEATVVPPHHFTSDLAAAACSVAHTQNRTSIYFDDSIKTRSDADKHRMLVPLQTAESAIELGNLLQDPFIDGLQVQYQADHSLDHVTPVGPYSFLIALYALTKVNGDTSQTPIPIAHHAPEFQNFLANLSDNAPDPLKSYATILRQRPRRIAITYDIMHQALKLLGFNLTLAVLDKGGHSVTPKFITRARSFTSRLPHFTLAELLDPLTLTFTLYHDPTKDHFIIAPPLHTLDFVESLTCSFAQNLFTKFSSNAITIYPTFPLTQIPCTNPILILSYILSKDPVTLAPDYAAYTFTAAIETGEFNTPIIKALFYGAELFHCTIDVLSPTSSMRLGTGPITCVLYTADYEEFQVIPHGYKHDTVPELKLTEARIKRSSTLPVTPQPIISTLVPVVTSTSAILKVHECEHIDTHLILVNNISNNTPIDIVEDEISHALKHYSLRPLTPIKKY